MNIYSSVTKELEIKSVEEWFNQCPPEGKEKQWVDYRSAKEMAQFWTNEQNQGQFAGFVRQKCEAFDFDYIVPEYRSSFDSFGKPRQHDLFISGKNNSVIITVEGKADESFGNKTFGLNFIEAAVKQKTTDPASKALDRMINLYQNYFLSDKNVLEIMYQLTYWFAGSLSDAVKFNTKNVIMVLQEFQSESLNKEAVKANHTEFEKFVTFISRGEYSSIKACKIAGPVNNPYTNNINVFIGYYPVELK